MTCYRRGQRLPVPFAELFRPAGAKLRFSRMEAVQFTYKGVRYTRLLYPMIPKSVVRTFLHEQGATGAAIFYINVRL